MIQPSQSPILSSAATRVASTVGLISDIGEEFQGENAFAKVSIRSLISKEKVCAILYDSTVAPQRGTLFRHAQCQPSPNKLAVV